MLMNLRLVSAAILLAGVLCARTGEADAAGTETIPVIPGEYLIRLAQGCTSGQLLTDLKQQVSPDVQVIEEITGRRLVKILVPAVSTLGRDAMAIPGLPVDTYLNAMVKTSQKIASLEPVAAVEPVTTLSLANAVPDDIARVKRSVGDAMMRVRLGNLPALPAGAPIKPVVVAVIDSGVMLQHEIFKGLLLDGKDVTGAASTAQAIALPDGRVETHGTGTAGMIALVIRGGIIDGPARANIKILPIRATLADDASIETPDAIKAIDYAIAHRVSIINASWGKNGHSEELRRALVDADAANIIVVTAAGNGRRANGENPAEPATGYDIDASPFYPASWSLENVVGVAALGLDDSLASFSNWGHKSVQLAAPGESIVVPTPLLDDRNGSLHSGYQAQSGTSISTAIAAGSIALFEAANPTMDYRSIVSRVNRAVTPKASLAGVLSSGGVLSVDALFHGAPVPETGPMSDVAFTRASTEKSLPIGKLAWLVKGPLAAGPIASEAIKLRGFDASGTVVATTNVVRIRVHLSPDKSKRDLRASLPPALGTVASIDEAGKDLYSLAIDTAMEKRAVAKVLRSLPGVQSADEKGD